MKLAKELKIGITLLATVGMTSGAPVLAQQVHHTDAGLASAALANGNAAAAIERLKVELERSPKDPALLINLGIAYAHMGDDTEALTHFKAALASREVVELDTADGRKTNSRRLARQALSMLERGEFRPDRVAAQVGG